MEESKEMGTYKRPSKVTGIEIEKDKEVSSNRRSSRIPTTEIFKNEFGTEDTENDEGPGPVISRFQRQNAKTITFDEGFEKGDLTYAPSNRHPYYMTIQRDQMLKMFDLKQMGQWATTADYPDRSSAGTAIQSYFNVSLKLFHDVANDCVDWLSLSRLVDPQVTPETEKNEKKEVETLKEMAFARLLDYPKNDPLHGQAKEESKNPPNVMPVNSMSQMALEDPPQQEKKSKTNIATIDAEWVSTKEKIELEIKEKKGRRIYVPVRHQMGWLMWLRLGTWKETPEARLGQLKKIKDGFKDVWMTATATDPESAAGYRARFSSANLNFPLLVVPEPDNLILRLQWPPDQVYTFFQSLVDKINNETSQGLTRLEVIKTRPTPDDARYVEMGENPFGLFTTYIAYDDFNTYMKRLETLEGHEDQNLTRKDAHRDITLDTNQVSARLTAMYQPMGESDSKGGTKYTKAQTDVICVMRGWETKIGIMPTDQMIYVKEGNTYDGKFGSTWRIEVSSVKISDARGKRIAKYAPAKIMGMSANEAAEKALGWQPLHKAKQLLGYDHRMTSGFFMAEWLHLCAFSWGGLTTFSQKGQLLYRSSDIPGNLVLGTSETNSVMTRFEKAWQTLVVDSPDLDSPFRCPKLKVTRNCGDEQVVRDARNTLTGNYFRTISQMSDKEKTLAKSHDFLAYTISYSMCFPKGCKLLNTGNSSSLHTTFYPFLRPLYHKLEDELDSVLYEGMKQRLHGTSMNSSLNPGPHNQNGQPVFTGVIPYKTTSAGINVSYINVVQDQNNPHGSGDDYDGMSKNTIKKRPVIP